VRHGPFLCLGLFLACAFGVSSFAPAASAQSAPKPSLGTLSGIVRDASGTPQLGATVELISETPGLFAAKQLMTDPQGFFRGNKLLPGAYTVRVTLAGFMPSLEKHVSVTANLTTVVRIQLESMFASIEQLRRPPTSGSVEPDDWKWVLRTATGLRPILQWDDGNDQVGPSLVMETTSSRPRGRVELTGGARRPGSVSNEDAAPGTAFAYDQRIDKTNHIVFAGQFSYDEDAPSGGLAAVWLPTGSLQNGPHSTMVLREARIGPNGQTFRGARIDQGTTLTFGERFLLRAGGEYVLVGVGRPAWSIRPRLKAEMKASENWYVDLIYAALPNGASAGNDLAADRMAETETSVLVNTLNQLDSFPALLWRKGRPVLESGLHQEVDAERKLGAHGVFQIAAFHDDNSHVALFGRGNAMPADEYFQDFYSKAFAYDGGSSSDWGARIALREKITDDLELTTIYAFSGALVPSNALDGALRDALRTVPRQSIIAKMTVRIPHSGTRLMAGYKWIDGEALSRVDPYGEGIYQLSPYLQIGVHQQLPRSILGRWEANAECDNLLAQGYIPLSTRDGQILVMPAARTFRGGLSLQF
jgi:Carboxypeptidase regulatory-like domain